MKAYNHQFMANNGSYQLIAIADFEDGRFHMFWGGRRWGCYNRRAIHWVLERNKATVADTKQAKRSCWSEEDEDYYIPHGYRIQPEDLLDYIKNWINERLQHTGHTEDLADKLMALDNIQ